MHAKTLLMPVVVKILQIKKNNNNIPEIMSNFLRSCSSLTLTPLWKTIILTFKIYLYKTLGHKIPEVEETHINLADIVSTITLLYHFC